MRLVLHPCRIHVVMCCRCRWFRLLSASPQREVVPEVVPRIEVALGLVRWHHRKQAGVRKTRTVALGLATKSRESTVKSPAVPPWPEPKNLSSAIDMTLPFPPDKESLNR